jgi:TRAP-type mannitol/chloroaromatic compound transport system substrate-binding protein
MDRRRFVSKAATAAAASGLIAAPAIAQSMPALQWRLTSSFPKTLGTIFGSAELFAKYVLEATDGQFKIELFGANEIVPALKAADAVSNGSVEMCQTASYYYIGKDPTYALGTTVPFGFNARQINAWFYYGGGIDMMNEFYATQGIYGLPSGNTGVQMGGWFRKEIKTPADFKGLKIRIPGFAARVLEKLGAVPQLLPADAIYEALEKGTIDAAEFVGPHDDEKFGFIKVAKYYYYPAWWEGGPALYFFINNDKWKSLPKSYQAIISAAAAAANVDMIAHYDAVNPPALKRLVASGAQLRPFSHEILDACLAASNELFAEISAANPTFKKIYDAQMAFRNDQYLWWQVAEYGYDNYMIRSRTKG